MWRFLPFHALSVHPEKNHDAADLVTPPFDVLGLTIRQELCSRHRHNFVRFESFRRLPDEASDVDARARAKESLTDITEAGRIQRQKSPSYYVLEVAQSGRTVRGIVGMLEIEGKSGVTWFESSFENDVADRIVQLDALELQTGPITIGYQESPEFDGEFNRLIASVDRHQPFVDFTHPDKGRHRLWKLAAADRDIEPHLAKRPLVILDGVERWRAAAKHAANAGADDHARSPFRAYNFIMSWIIPMNPDTVLFRPRHRVLRVAATPMPNQLLLEKLEDYFEIERYKLTKPGAKEAELVNLLDEMDLIGKLQHAYGLYIGDNAYYLLYLRDADAYEQMASTQRSRRWKRLDVNILHAIVFQDILGIGWQTPNDLAKLAMPITPIKGIALVDDGFAHSFFLLNPPPLEHILELAEAKEEIPARSTLLECRPLVGAVMARVGARDYVGDFD